MLPCVPRQAHSSVEKGSLIGLVKLRLLDTDDQLSLRGNVFGEAVKEDIENGFIPFYVSTAHTPRPTPIYMCRQAMDGTRHTSTCIYRICSPEHTPTCISWRYMSLFGFSFAQRSVQREHAPSTTSVNSVPYVSPIWQPSENSVPYGNVSPLRQPQIFWSQLRNHFDNLRELGLLRKSTSTSSAEYTTRTISHIILTWS